MITSFRIGSLEKEDKKPKIDKSIDFASMLKWCFLLAKHEENGIKVIIVISPTMYS